MGGAYCLQSGQSPAAVAQGIAGSQLLGYTYQASTLDPNASAVDSRRPGKLTPSRSVPSCCDVRPRRFLPTPQASLFFCFFLLQVDGPLIASHVQTGTRGAASMPNIAVNILLKTQRPSSVLHTAATRSRTKTTQIFDSQDVKPRPCSFEARAGRSQC